MECESDLARMRRDVEAQQSSLIAYGTLLSLANKNAAWGCALSCLTICISKRNNEGNFNN